MELNSSPRSGHHQLKSERLTRWDAVGMSITVLSPAGAMAYNTSLAATVAGGSTPLAFLLAGVACLTLAFVVISFSKLMASAGYAYTYVSRTLGHDLGFLTGWLYSFGFFCFVPMTMAGVGGFTRNLISLEFDINIPWFLIFMVGMGIVVSLAVYDIKLSSRTQLLVGVISIGTIVILDIIVLLRGGLDGHSLQPFSYGYTVRGEFGGIFYGVIFGVLSYIGFETSAVLGEEIRDPLKSLPVSMVIVVSFAIIFYVWTTYIIAIGIGVNNGEKWAASPSVLADLAEKYSSHLLSVLISIGAILSTFVVCLACTTAATRTMFAMGRESVLPKWLARTHPTYKTPVNATLFTAGLATAVAAIVGSGFDYESGPFMVFGILAGIGAVAVMIVYIVLCAAGIVWFRKVERNYNLFIHALVPFVGMTVFGLAVYTSVWPLPPMPFRMIPFVNLAWILVGVGFLFYLKGIHPERVARIGTVLGEEGRQVPPRVFTHDSSD